MRLSQHFGRTLREAPSDVTNAGATWLMRAGMIRAGMPGIWDTLSLGRFAFRRMEHSLADALGFLAAEEVQFTDTALLDVLIDREVESYKDLPRTLYQTQTIGPSQYGGLISLRESRIHESLTLHTDHDQCRDAAQQLHHIYLAFFARCGLPVVLSDAGTQPATYALPHPQGHEQIAHCPECGFLSMLSTAAFDRGPGASAEPERPLEKVATPDCKTIADLCAFLGVEARQTLKAVFVTLDAGTMTERSALIMLRGDLDVSQEKVKQVTKARTLQQATEEEIRERIGATPGYASPIGIREDALVILDESIEGMTNFVTGANSVDAHYINANYPRDFSGMIADAALANPGAGCPRCDGVLTIEPAAILGEMTMHALTASYLDASGSEQPVIMGRTRIDLDQVLCAIADLHCDEHGIRWPLHAAPLDVHIICIAKSEEASQAADTLYDELQGAGIGVLYDDRNLGPGVMFADADLIGLPLRVTISPRSLENGGYEIKWRMEDERTILPATGASSVIGAWLAEGRPVHPLG